MSLGDNEFRKVQRNATVLRETYVVFMWCNMVALGKLARFFCENLSEKYRFLAKTPLHFNEQIFKAKFTSKVHLLQATVTFSTLSFVGSNTRM